MNYHPGKTFTRDTLKTLLEEVGIDATDWPEIGRALDLQESLVNAFFRGTQECPKKYKLSWPKLAQALEMMGGYPSAAQKARENAGKVVVTTIHCAIIVFTFTSRGVSRICKGGGGGGSLLPHSLLGGCGACPPPPPPPPRKILRNRHSEIGSEAIWRPLVSQYSWHESPLNLSPHARTTKPADIDHCLNPGSLGRCVGLPTRNST